MEKSQVDNMIERIKDWLRLMRAQTAPATLLLIMVPFLLGGGELFSLQGGGMVLFAISVHFWSFGENSLLDTTQGFDTEDEAKQHHPLIQGNLSEERAMNVIHWGLVFVGLLGAFLAMTGEGNFGLSMLFLFFFWLWGETYNKGLSKVSIWGFVPITLCFTSMSLYAYFVSAGHLSFSMMVVTFYVMFRIWVQIDLEGNLKDMEAPENNMLENMGAKVEEEVIEEEHKGITFKTVGKIFKPGYAMAYGTSLTVIEFMLGVFLLFKMTVLMLRPAIVITVSVISTSFLMVGVVLTLGLLTEHQWDRERDLRLMGICEILFIYALVIITMPLIGYLEGIILLIFGVIWFFGMNKLLWGTDHPDV